MANENMKIKVTVDGVQGAKQQLGGLTSSMGKLVTGVAAAAAAFYTLKKSFDAAVIFKNASRDAEEMGSKFGTVFESISIQAENTANSLANSFGIANTTAMQLLGSTGDLLVGFGFTEQKALEMSDAVNRLAIDLASFQNYVGGAEGASAALTKAILGETESAKSLGIVIRQDTKEFKDQVKELQALEHITAQQAKAQIILEQAYTQSSKAVGDFTRTQHQLANQERILEEVTKKFKEMIGDKLQPVFIAATEDAIGFMRSLTETPLGSTIRELEELGAAAEDILILKKFNWSTQLEDVNSKLKKAGVNYEDIKDVTKEIGNLQSQEIDLLLRRGQVLSDQEMTYTQVKNTYMEMGLMEEDAIVKADTWLSMTKMRGRAEQMVEKDINDQLESIKDSKKELSKYSDLLIDRETLEAKIAQDLGEQTEEIITQIEELKKLTDITIKADILEADLFLEAWIAAAEELQAKADEYEIVVPMNIDMTASKQELLDDDERIRKEMEGKWQETGGIMSNAFYEAFDGQTQNIEDMFENLWKRILADLAASGLMALISSLTGGAFGGTGFFGSGGLFSGLFGGTGGTINNNVTVQPTPVIINFDPIQVSRSAEAGDIMRS